jgi:asparagine synthase (glutamine-hydrolysing)
MLAGILDPVARADALRGRLAPFTRPRAVALIADGLAVVGDGIHGGAAGGHGFMLQGTIDNLPGLSTELALPRSADAGAILTAALGRYGSQTPSYLRGDFALVAWDRAGRAAWLAQDQVGVGAIFWSDQDGEFCFASEIHLLLSLMRRRPSPDEDSVIRFLAGSAPRPRSTLYSGVHRLGAGRQLRSRDGRLEVGRYHELGYQPPFEGSRLEIAARLREALLSAVSVRVQGAGSVGITLSGGFDSAVVAAAASVAVPKERLRGYSSVFPDVAGMDDRDLLDVLVDAYGLVNRRYANEPGGILRTAIAYTAQYSLPLVGPGWVTEVPLLVGASRDGIDVLLDGQGGDETFGATPYLVADELRGGRPNAAINLIRHSFQGAWRGVSLRAALPMITEYGARPLAPNALRDVIRARRDPRRYAPPLLAETIARSVARDDDEYAWTRTRSGPIWWSHLRHLLTTVREDNGLGDYIRQRSEWFGLRGRPPLFDLGLTETTLRIPPEMRFDAHLDRPIAREAVAGLLPDAIRLSRRKSNLAPFYCRGLAGPDHPLLSTLLGAPDLEIARWVRRDALAELVNHPPSGAVTPAAANHWTTTIWPAVSLELWLRAERDPGLIAAFDPAPLLTREL